MNSLFNKNMLITGATGSFGLAFTKYLSNAIKRISKRGKPKGLGFKEYLNNYPNVNLIGLARDWHKLNLLEGCLPVIGDIRDYKRILNVIKAYDIDIIVHAGALKDVFYCEQYPTECLETNVVGTQNIIDACHETNVECAILISTDKAVLPVNTYGTSKKMAEKLWINANNRYACKFSVCRYGNVIGSAGSVLPVYLNLIKDGAESLPVTDIRCTRFWYPMQDAIDFIIESLVKMHGTETFIPKIPSIKIVDLVKALDKEIDVIGLREGEKIHEYLIPPNDVTGDEGYSSFNNNHYLTIDEIKESIKNVKI